MNKSWEDLGVTESFPRQKAATRNFQLGAPRSFHICDDGATVLFLRSSHGRDAANSLWAFDVATKKETILVDVAELSAVSEDLPAAERARRERMRETAAGITNYSTDDSGRVLTFALSGALYVTHVDTKKTTALNVTSPVIDPHMSPDGTRVAWSTGSAVYTVAIDGTDERLVHQGTETQVVGLADFIAAEEHSRMSGMWWSPNSDGLLVEVSDDQHVATWWIANPAVPGDEPRSQRYPAAGTQNADVNLLWCPLDGDSVTLDWDKSAYEYLIRVNWKSGHDALITLSDRTQRKMDTFALHGTALECVVKLEDNEFLEVIPGQPAWLDNGSLLTVVDNRSTDTREVQIDGNTISPRELQIMGVIDVHHDGVTATVTENAVDRDVAFISFDGTVTLQTNGGVNAATPTNTASGKARSVVVGSHVRDGIRRYQLVEDGEVIHDFASHAENPTVKPIVHTIQTGPYNVNTAVLFPTGHEIGSKKLPVLMRPYGGPHGAQVVNSALIYVEDQWWADQGFVVIVADGRGTPGRGPAWDHAIFHNFVEPVLEDQISALHEVAETWIEDVDLDRVGISGWSFGGYLSALAVLEKPDVFHAAVAGAPVTHWEWYDTAYTERYLGDPRLVPDVYAHNSLLHRAPNLRAPLMLIHGLADDNVVVAHTLALSNELMAAGRMHTVLPLSGVTHMTPQEDVAENLLLLQVQFFNEHLKK